MGTNATSESWSWGGGSGVLLRHSPSWVEEDLEGSSAGLRSAGWAPHWSVDPAPRALWAARGEGFSEGHRLSLLGMSAH